MTTLTLTVVLIGGCSPQEPPPTPTPTPTVARPRFEITTYMYALQTKSKIRIGVLDGAPALSAREPSGRRSGFEVEDLVEIRPPPAAHTRYPYVTLEWARQWPCEEAWKARKG